MTTITMEKHILKRLDALEDFAKEIRAALAAPATAPAQPERKPTTDDQCVELFHKVQRGMGFKDQDVIPFTSGIAAAEHFHGIKDKP